MYRGTALTSPNGKPVTQPERVRQVEREKKKGQRGRLGYGSSYRKGSRKEMSAGKEIGSVLGGQVWLVKPDCKAKADFPCLWIAAGQAGA